MKVLAVCAGLAMSSVVMAADPIAEFVPASEVRMVPMEAYTGILKPAEAGIQVVQRKVYDNMSFTTYWTTTTATVIGLEDIQLAPGPGLTATYPLLITAMGLSFQVKTVDGAGARAFDLEVTFYDTVNPTAAAGTSVIAASTPIAAFVVPFNITTGVGVYTTPAISLAALAGGGITLPDGGCFARVRFLVPGSTTTLMLGTEVGCAFQSGINQVAPSFAGTKTCGASHNGMWINFDNDTIPLEVADRAGFGFPAALDWGITMEITEADAPFFCPADFNLDGVVDFFDYLDFVDAFSAPCP